MNSHHAVGRPGAGGGGGAGGGTGFPEHAKLYTRISNAPPLRSEGFPRIGVVQPWGRGVVGGPTDFPHMQLTPFSVPARGRPLLWQTWAQYLLTTTVARQLRRHSQNEDTHLLPQQTGTCRQVLAGAGRCWTYSCVSLLFV